MMKPGVSRRDLLSGGAAIGSAAVGFAGGAHARVYSGKVPWERGSADAPQAVQPGPYQFFSAEEAAFIDAAVARLIPQDDLGPGAREAGVTGFLDAQLAGAYGAAQTWYMQGPWRPGEDTQGYQSRLTPAQLYRVAIKAINDHCRKEFDGQAFAELSETQQDATLTRLEKGDIKIAGLGPHPIEVEGVTGDTFFAQLLQNAIEGFFCDPVHGGNRDMVGWKLIGFPGARYDYRPYVSQHGKKLDLEPVAITGRPGWNPPA
jgi:gluconate 2-dehydrogenase gamma chain